MQYFLIFYIYACKRYLELVFSFYNFADRAVYFQIFIVQAGFAYDIQHISAFVDNNPLRDAYFVHVVEMKKNIEPLNYSFVYATHCIEFNSKKLWKDCINITEYCTLILSDQHWLRSLLNICDMTFLLNKIKHFEQH